MRIKNDSWLGCFLSSHRLAVPDSLPRRTSEEFNEDVVVTRGDIEFFDVTRESVCVRIMVRNSSEYRSPSRLMAVYSAPLGAFLPWSHLVTLTIPSLRPGAKLLMETVAKKTRPLPLGRIDRIPPSRLVAALAEDDDAKYRARLKRLAPSILDYFKPSGDHWVGNINIFVNNHQVERHLTRGLRVQPGRLNRAIFMVGNGNLSEAYAFRIYGDGIAWESRLFAMPLPARSLVRTSGGIEIEEDRWIEASRARVVNLQFRPPENSRRGKIDVEVTQRSTGRKTVVEFTLDAGAEGPGCHVA